MSNFCPNCGASIDSPARYCRKCGQQLAPMGTSVDATEVTTRTLEEQYPVTQASTNQFTQVVNPGFTSPAYLPPDGFQSNAPRGFQPPASSGHNGLIIAAVVAAFLLAALAILVPAVTRYLGHRGAVEQATASRPELPSLPPPPPVQPPSSRSSGSTAVPAVPVQLPTVPEPPKEKSSSGSEFSGFDSFRYPGAEVTMQVGDKAGKLVLGLHTSDSLSKVADWYKQHGHFTKIVQVPFGATTILKESNTSVVLTPSGDGTQILLTHDGDD